MVAICDLARASSEESGTENQIVKQDWHVGLHLGFSSFTSVFGLEVQHHNFAFSAGFPLAAGIKYYLKPDGHSWFAGGYFLRFSDLSGNEGGIGSGFRWRWGSGWDLDLGFTLGYGEKNEISGPGELITDYIRIRPIITLGYSF